MNTLSRRTPRVHPRHPDAPDSVSRDDRHATSAEGPGQSKGQTLRLLAVQRRLAEAIGRDVTARDVVEFVARFDLTVTQKQGRPSPAYVRLDPDLGTAALYEDEVAPLLERLDTDAEFRHLVEFDVL